MESNKIMSLIDIGDPKPSPKETGSADSFRLTKNGNVQLSLGISIRDWKQTEGKDEKVNWIRRRDEKC